MRLWLVPMAILGGVALLAFASVYVLDATLTGGAPGASHDGALARYVHLEPGLISDAVAGLAAMTAAVLGIVITVVSLLVQLTSARYTCVAQMFLRDRTNVVVTREGFEVEEEGGGEAAAAVGGVDVEEGDEGVVEEGVGEDGVGEGNVRVGAPSKRSKVPPGRQVLPRPL